MEFHFIGWNNSVDRKKGVKHDKVWCAFKSGDCWYAGWGARGKTLSFKNHGSNRWNPDQPPTELAGLANKKRASGYEPVDQFQLFTIFPTFEEDVDKGLFFKTLANKIM